MNTGTPWIDEKIFAYLAKSGATRQRMHQRYHYYHHDNLVFFQQVIEPGRRVLVAGCGIEEIVASLKDCQVLGLELGPQVTPLKTSTGAVWLSHLEEAATLGPIDFVILPYTLQFLNDIQSFLQSLGALLQPRARIIVLNYNFLWAPVLQMAQRIHLKTPMPDLNWLSPNDVHVLLRLSGFQVIQNRNRCLVPFYLPVLTPFINQYLGPLPLVNALAQKQFFVARPLPASRPASPSCSVIVPARNEEGSLQQLLDRLPVMGSATEVIFVEGHSKDRTWEAINHQIATHPRRDLFRFKALQQTGEGKADAVQLGFEYATNDIVMILDADISVQPEDLPHFFVALASGVGEFMNGSRLVYQMERAAMQVLNLFFNKLFGTWMSWIIGQPIKDTLCGTKAFFRKDYLRMRPYMNDISKLDPFGDFKLILGASKLQLKIMDVPVRYRERIYGSTNISRFQAGWKLLQTCLKAWGRMI